MLYIRPQCDVGCAVAALISQLVVTTLHCHDYYLCEAARLMTSPPGLRGFRFTGAASARPRPAAVLEAGDREL